MGRTAATLGGAGTGAAIGTAIMPGVGTALGAVGGGLLGYLGSSSDTKAQAPPIDPRVYQYGGNMSGVGNERVQGYDTQGGAYRSEATHAQGRGISDYGAQQSANNAAYNANQAATHIGQQGVQAQQQSLARQQAGNNALAAFANQPQGPSAAQAQLQQGANQAFAQQMAAARSGTNAGGQANAMRGAAFQQAGIMGNMNAQQAALRAQEGQAYQQQRLAALGAAQQGYSAEAGTAGQMRGADFNNAQLQAQTQLQGGQLQAGTQLGYGNLQAQNRQQNDAYSLGLGQLAAGQDQFSQNVYAQQAAMNMRGQEFAAGQAMQANQLNMQADQANNAGMFGMASGGMGAVGSMLSDTREKKDIAHAQGVADALAALGERRTPFSARAAGQGFSADTSEFNTSYGDARDATRRVMPIDRGTVVRSQVPRDSDLSAAGYYDRPQTAAVARFPDAPGVARSADVPTARFQDTDLRMPAYEYGYRNPFSPGAAPGRHVGPMAQQLEQNPATAGTVQDTPQGKMVDPGRLTMVNTSAIGEQQQRLDALEKQLAALGVQPNRTSYGGADLNALDDAYARDRAYR